MDNSAKYRSVFNSDFSETVAYNNPLFPAYVSYGFLSTYPDYSSVSHWHKDRKRQILRLFLKPFLVHT